VLYRSTLNAYQNMLRFAFRGSSLGFRNRS